MTAAARTEAATETRSERTAGRMAPPAAGNILPCLLVALLACGTARRDVQGDVVHSIKLDGNGGFNSGHDDYTLRQEMEQGDSRFGVMTWPLSLWVKPQVLDDEALWRDAYRLEVWYAHQGWFDAQVRGWQIQRIRARTERRAGVVDIRGFVDPGPVSTVRTLEVTGVQPALEAVVGSVLRMAPVQQGAQFSLEGVNTTRDQILDKLRDYGRAYAEVTTEITSVPAEQAVDVKIAVDAGIPCTIGPITVEGEKAVDEQLIRDRMKIAEGDPYSLKELREARQRLFKTGTLSVVTFTSDLGDPTRPDVPLEVKVTEADFRTLRVGGGFEYDSYIATLRASTRFTHVNLFHELLRAELGGEVGVGLAFSEDRPLPTYGVDTKITYPRIAHQQGALELSALYEQDIYAGLWTYRKPDVDFHFVWQWNDDVIFRVGPHFEQYHIVTADFDVEEQLDTLKRLFGIEDPDSLDYELTALDQIGVWDWRDDPNRPTRGSYYTLDLREAFKLSESGTSFLRASGEARRYVPLRFKDRPSAFPVTLAGKVRGTGVVPFGATETIPLPERAFSGGPNSIRGFRTSQVGSYETVCVYDTTSRGSLFGIGGSEPYQVLSRYDLPDGGELSGEVSGEVRYDWANSIVLAAFADAGFLSSDAFDLGTADARWSVGAGVRYDTVVGPVRFDVSVRPLYPEDNGPVGGFQGCEASRWNGNTFVDDRQVRVSDLFGNFPGLRDPADHPNFAVVFYITIGESI